MPVEYLVHKKPFKLLLFCTCVKCTTIEKMLRGIMTGRLSIQQLQENFFSKSNIFGRQVFGTYILAGIYIGNQKCSGNKHNLLHSVRAHNMYFVQPNHPFLKHFLLIFPER